MGSGIAVAAAHVFGGQPALAGVVDQADGDAVELGVKGV